MENDRAPEFYHPLSIERLGEQGFETRIVASDGERAALATRFSLLALDPLGGISKGPQGRPGCARTPCRACNRGSGANLCDEFGAGQKRYQ